MTWLLDTVVVSEWTKGRPDAGVAAWLERVDEDTVFLSVVTLAELRQGIEALAEGAKRRRLEDWYAGALLPRFASRVLPIERRVAELWAPIRNRAKAARSTMPVMDAFLAATAEAHGLTLVTRNERDFRAAQIRVLNPWAD